VATSAEEAHPPFKRCFSRQSLFTREACRDAPRDVLVAESALPDVAAARSASRRVFSRKPTSSCARGSIGRADRKLRPKPRWTSPLQRLNRATRRPDPKTHVTAVDHRTIRSAVCSEGYRSPPESGRPLQSDAGVAIVRCGRACGCRVSGSGFRTEAPEAQPPAFHCSCGGLAVPAFQSRAPRCDPRYRRQRRGFHRRSVVRTVCRQAPAAHAGQQDVQRLRSGDHDICGGRLIIAVRSAAGGGVTGTHERANVYVG